MLLGVTVLVIVLVDDCDRVPVTVLVTVPVAVCVPEKEGVPV